MLGGTAALGVERLTGRAATETRLRAAVAGKRIVHLATHGFFATGRARSSLAAIPQAHARLVARGEPQAGYNPLLLAGLVFWVVHALLDSIWFYEDAFGDLLRVHIDFGGHAAFK